MRRMAAVFVGIVLVLVGCGGSTDPLGAGDDAANSSDDVADTGDGEGTPPDESGDDPAGIAGDLPGCDLATATAPEVAAALAETIRTDAEIGPAVLTDDDLGGQTLTTTLVVDGGADYLPVSWAVGNGPDGPRLLPLTQKSLAVSPPDSDTSRLLEPGPDGVIVQGDTPGSGGMALGSDCSLILAQELYPPPPAPPAELREDLMVANPPVARPGDVVELTFPEKTSRGIAFQLDRREDDGWTTEWWMTSDANGGQPTTVAAGTEGYSYDDIGFEGPGPDRVLVHPDTAPGDYRICTANAGEEFCTPLTVTDD